MRFYTQPPSSLTCIGGASAGSVSRRAPTLFSKAVRMAAQISTEEYELYRGILTLVAEYRAMPQGKKASRGKKASQEKKKDPVAAGSQMEEQETLYAKREEVGRLRA